MATFKSKMSKIDKTWADKIWHEVSTGNKNPVPESSDKYQAWVEKGKPGTPLSIRLPVAALAVTGARPISLERGIVFEFIKGANGDNFLQATAQGAKLVRDKTGAVIRGQEEVKLRWKLSAPRELGHREKELKAIIRAMQSTPEQKLTISYNAESISTRLREISKELWPRRKTHISAICYRELFSMASKDADTDPLELAAAMGHLSARSQEKYHRRQRGTGRISPAKPFSEAISTTQPKAAENPADRLAAFKAKIKIDAGGSVGSGGASKSPMRIADFKAAAALKKAMTPRPR